MKWTVRLNGGPQRVNHAAAAVGNKIYSFGGYCTDDDYQNRRPIDVFALDTDTLRWSIIASGPAKSPVDYMVTPFQRYGHTAVAYEEVIFVWGGRNDIEACNRLFCFNTELLQWVPVKATGQVPGARDGHSACIVGHSMYIFGGFEEYIGRLSRAVYVLDLRKFIWRHLKANGEPPGRRDFHSATSIGDLMFIFGGRGGRLGLELENNDEKYCNRLFCLDTKSVTWSELPTRGAVPCGRRSHSAFSYCGRLYIFGGYNGYLDRHFSDIYCYKLDGSWSAVKASGQGPRERRRQCCCVCGDRVFLFGGTSPIVGAQSRMRNRNEDPHLMDHDDLHILDFAPTLKTLAKVAVIENNLDQTYLPHDIRWEIQAMTTANTITKTPVVPTGDPLFNG